LPNPGARLNVDPPNVYPKHDPARDITKHIVLANDFESSNDVDNALRGVLHVINSDASRVTSPFPVSPLRANYAILLTTYIEGTRPCYQFTQIGPENLCARRAWNRLSTISNMNGSQLKNAVIIFNHPSLPLPINLSTTPSLLTPISHLCRRILTLCTCRDRRRHHCEFYTGVKGVLGSFVTVFVMAIVFVTVALGSTAHLYLVNVSGDVVVAIML
jgi:hypothetical protein